MILSPDDFSNLKTVTFLTWFEGIDNIFEGSVAVKLGLKTEPLFVTFLGGQIFVFKVENFVWVFRTHCFCIFDFLWVQIFGIFIFVFLLVQAVATVLALLDEVFGAGSCGRHCTTRVGCLTFF